MQRNKFSEISLKNLIRTLRRSGARFSLALLALATAGCGDDIQSAINPSGPQAYRVNQLWWLMFSVCSIVFVIVMIALLLALRKKTADSHLATLPILEP